MTEPGHHLIGRMYSFSRADRGASDHDHRKTQHARGFQLGAGALATGILGDDAGDLVFDQQRMIVGCAERAAGDDCLGIGQGERRFGWVDQAEQVVMLRRGGEMEKPLPPDREKNALRRAIQRCGCAGDVGDAMPMITCLREPGRALESDQRNPGCCCRFDCIPAHRRGERVGSVNQRGKRARTEVVGQPGRAAKSADADLDRLLARFFDATGVGKNCCDPRFGAGLCQRAGLGRAAQNEGLVHG